MLGYFIPRENFYGSLLAFTGLFILYTVIYNFADFSKNFWHFLWLAVILRLMLLFSLPTWSDDYVRFIWDGQLLLEGHNPYAHTPTEALGQLDLKSRDFMDQLYPGLNSPEYHSVYPPSNQVIFGLAVFLTGGNLLFAVMILRLILIAFELMSIYLIYKLLLLWNKPRKKVLLYAINPLVIMEISGNLHFEGLMLALMLGSLYFLSKKRHIVSGALMGAAVGVKLSPLILVPAFIKFLFHKNLVPYILGGASLVLLGLFPLLVEESFSGFRESLSLYGERFEFNASLYYLLREVGYWTNGYNMIGFFNPILKGLTVAGILWISLKVNKGQTDSLIHILLLVYWVYFLLNTVVHPWYILPALALSLFTEKKAFLVWSFLIFLSYHAYQTEEYKELAWILGLEYVGLFMALWWDYGGRFLKPLMFRK
jgi:hypothetical protein